MDLQHTTIKLFAERADFELHELIPIFHRWIQTNAIADVLLVDVADYAHVPEGPGVMLIAHEGHFSFDVGAVRTGNAQPGVVYANKRKAIGSSADRIRRALALAVRAASLLENEKALEGKVRFTPNQLLIRFDDYLHLANNDASLDQVRSDVEQVLTDIYQGAQANLTRDTNSKTGLTVDVNVDSNLTLSEIAAKLT